MDLWLARSRSVLLLAPLLVMVGTGRARADETRFAVVDLQPTAEHEKILAAIEKDVARLRPGARAIDDPVMHRLLGSGEAPADAAHRLLQETERAKNYDDCPKAIVVGAQAEELILSSLSLDDERDPLKQLYSALVVCNHKLNRANELAVAATRLRQLVSLPPSQLPNDLWDKYVANAIGGPANVELQIDSDPPNATVAINLHGDGATPRTLQVPAGLAFVEVQKEGFKKAFRAVTMKDRPVRVALRLIDRAHDRTEQASVQLKVLGKAPLKEQSGTMSRLSQMARVETLVLMKVSGDNVEINFFDAERGALTEAPIKSPYDKETGRVAALAARPTPGGGTNTAAPGNAAPGNAAAGAAAAAGPTETPPADVPLASLPSAGGPPPSTGSESREPPLGSSAIEGLPEARSSKQQATYIERRKRPGAPWWSWLIAGAVAAGFLTFMLHDRTGTADHVTVRATWPGGGQ